MLYLFLLLRYTYYCKKTGYDWYDSGASRSHTLVTSLRFFLPPQCRYMMLCFFDDGMTIIICLNMMYPSLMLHKTAAEEQLDDIIHGSRKKKGNKKKKIWRVLTRLGEKQEYDNVRGKQNKRKKMTLKESRINLCWNQLLSSIFETSVYPTTYIK